MKKIALIPFGTTLLMPLLALAQDTTYVDTWIRKATGWLSQAITVIMVLMTIWFLIGVFRYVAEKDPGKLADKRKTMLAGLIGLFVAVSVWGIINIAGSVFGTRNAQQSQITCPPGTRVDPFTNRCII